MTLDPAGLEAAAKALQADRGAPTTHAGRYDSHRATVAVRAYLAAVLPPDEENPRRWFVGVSADRPMEIQFTEANGPGGWVQADEHDRAVARAFAAGRAAATPDPPKDAHRPWPIAPDTVMPPRRQPVRWGSRADDPPTEIHNDPQTTKAYLAGLAAGRTEAAASPDERLREENERLHTMLGKVPQEQLARIMAATDRDKPEGER